MNVRDEIGITNKFVLNWLDMLYFLLQGLPADGTMDAVIGYMLGTLILYCVYSIQCYTSPCLYHIRTILLTRIHT